ncbi:MAG TPA: DUF1326 domain-containing protein [Sporichthyaceae bacterium]|jgi:hypothetical protein|nr:DUF1326 domain-containing protein [Sporichthyaceae bacterium]
MTTTTIPQWTLQGDWFDVCSCNVPCPCTFAQAPTNNECTAMFAYRITSGQYGDTDLAGLNVCAIVGLVGNIWEAETKCSVGLLVDDRADPVQMEALQAIFGGAAGGWPAAFATKIGEFHGIEVVPVQIEIADDLSTWGVEVSGRYKAFSTALTGPTADPNKRVQVLNAPGSEVGPSEHARTTYATGHIHQTGAGPFGYDLGMISRSSKHIPFAWSGPDR